MEEMSLLSQTVAALGFGVSKTSIGCTRSAGLALAGLLGGVTAALGGHRCSPGYICTSLYLLSVSVCPCFLCVSE